MKMSEFYPKIWLTIQTNKLERKSYSVTIALSSKHWELKNLYYM